MRIFLNGIGAFGVDTLQKLQAQGDEIVAVAAPPQSLSGRADRLWAYAADAGIPVFETKRLAEPEVEAALRQTAPELGVMAFVEDLIKASTLGLPAHGTIQYHPSLLPKHRGRSAINWSIIQGESKTGISIFWPDEGLDTGPVLLQREVEIGPDDTTGSLYYDKLYPLGLEALADAVDLVRQGRAPKTPQDESQATYERPCDDKAAQIDWARPLTDVYNLVRGCDPSPGAWSPWRETKVRMLGATPLPDQTGSPGVVQGIDDEGVIIGALNGALRIKTLRVDTDPTKSTQDVIADNSIVVGSEFEAKGS
jgi:methionyl-tRNA formyltransferase